MQPEEIRHILSQGEGTTIEFKDTSGGLPTSFYESAVSFSNTDGGVILLGVDDDGVIIGLTTEECKHMQKDIVTALNTPDCVWPSIFVQPFILNLPKGAILVCQIPVSSQVHQYKTDIYVRENEADIRITNPNRPLFHGFINRNNFAPYAKNPNLRKFFTAFGWTEEIGSGVRNTSHYLPLYTGGALPTFEEKEIFVTRLPLKHYVFRPYVADFAAWLSLPVDCKEHLMTSMAEIELPTRLHDATWETVVLDLVPSWVEKGTKLPDFFFAKNQYITEQDIQKEPSWKEKGTKLLPKKIWYIVTILALCGHPTSFGQLMEFFQYKNRNTFRNNYINPLKRLGFLTVTIPEKTNSPDNKYITTDLGKEFLMGNH